MMEPIVIKLNAEVKVVGDGIWLANKYPETILLTVVEIVDPRYDESANDAEPGSLSVSIYFEGWDINQYGLLYTDSSIETIQQLLNEQLDKKISIEWSEQSMQEVNWLHFDAEFVNL